MKSTEELNALKEEVEMLNKKLSELSEEELAQVVGGISPNCEGEKQDYNVAIFPGVSAFP